MHYIIAFDVSDDKVRRKLCKMLLNKGVRIQESVFAVNLKKHEVKSMTKNLEKTLNKQGIIHIINVCGTCAKKSLAINKEIEYYATD
ncbi:MAG: CRISPR-associated endonuclease Cas2 [Candidatus Cloacimonetes bacterium]|jgi:CRISPR-associated endonuclease Cas2|nr:CRISPR-associated endonuclease Cas2 [Candidatus Cloacimonadota bacterium]